MTTIYLNVKRSEKSMSKNKQIMHCSKKLLLHTKKRFALLGLFMSRTDTSLKAELYLRLGDEESWEKDR